MANKEPVSMGSFPADWDEWFSDWTVEKGRKLQRAGKVLSCSVRPDESRISATVSGSAPAPYAVEVRWGGDENIDGICSCPVGFNCKHVVAAIFEALHLATNS